MLGNAEVMIAEWFLRVYMKPLPGAIRELEKFRENSREAKLIKFLPTKRHQSEAGTKSKKGPDQGMVDAAEQILKDHPPEKPKSYKALADYLTGHLTDSLIKKPERSLKFSEFKKSWVYKHRERFKHHVIKKKRSR